MGGEKSTFVVTVLPSAGSPPRGRGKAGNNLGCLHDVGITPARAGKRFPSSSPAVRPEDHPRACGEKNKELEGVWLPMGSPPRGRGKAELSAAIDHVLGITPAWAGKRAFFATICVIVEDHPRVSGEKTILLKNSSPYSGSPPRGRGKVVGTVADAVSMGITPAWAGKNASQLNPRP